MELPSDITKVDRVLLEYRMGAWNKGPGEWDNTTMLFVEDKASGERYEIARAITPYGGGFGKYWNKTFWIDVTEYLPMLSGSTTFYLYYGGWDANDNRAHTATITLHYYNGTPKRNVVFTHELYDSSKDGNSGYRGWAYGVAGHDIEDVTRLGERIVEVPAEVKWSFYIGAIAMIICVLYTSIKVKEFTPEEYAKMNNIRPEDKTEKTNFVALLKRAPAAFWQIGLVQFFCWFAFMMMWTYTNGAIAENVWGATDKSMPGFQEAGNWVGVLFAVQSVASVLWALVLPRFRNTKSAYSTSLVLAGIGFISTLFIRDQYVLCLSFALVGCGWAAMLAMPFAMLTNSLSGKSMGAYLGLFNCTICLPQIIASLVGGVLLSACGGERIYMLLIAGISLLIAAVAVYGISVKRNAE
jgi:MFS family permease